MAVWLKYLNFMFKWLINNIKQRLFYKLYFVVFVLFIKDLRKFTMPKTGRNIYKQNPKPMVKVD